MSSSRPEGETSNGEKKYSHALDAEPSDFGGQNSRVSQEHSSTASGSDSRDQDGSRSKFLNSYGLVATTVPPFALDEQLKQQNLRQVQTHSALVAEKELGRYCKDPFLVSHNLRWGPFAENVGSNAAYFNKATKPATGSPGFTLYEDDAGPSSSAVSTKEEEDQDINKTAGESSSYEEDKSASKHTRTEAPHDVFADLNGSWGGSERLNAIFNGPLLDSDKLTSHKDRNDWSEYLESVKAFYYTNGPLNQDLEAGLRREGSSNLDDTEENKLHTFLEKQRSDFKETRKHWRQLERQKKQKWVPTLRKLLLDSQYLPLSFRMFIVILSAIALGLAIRIFQNSKGELEFSGSSVPQQASTIMAICVNSIAVLYLFYIAYDEFSGKPLGLRDPVGKLRLILLDLLFIIFSSANLALTFNTLYDKQWVCTEGKYSEDELPKMEYICRKQRALASFLFVVLFMWVVTFTVSILRVVEKMSSGSPR
ncbi:hypothetical protein ACU8KH_05623 [Lachancea thermotolerans]